MRVQISLGAAILSVILTAASTAQSQPPATPAAGNPRCDLIAPLDPVGVRRTLETFAGPVLGKVPERWTLADFDAVRASAVACDRYVNERKQEVRVNTWITHMNLAQKTVLPVSAELTKLEQDNSATLAAAPWLPPCTSLVEWRRDRRTWRSNAKELFGKDLLELSPDEIATARGYVATCANVIDMIGAARRLRVKLGTMIVDDIVYALDKSQEAIDEIPKGRDIRTLTVKDDDGRKLPLAYLTPQSRMIVGIVNRSYNLDRPLSIDELNEVIGWADKTISDNESDVETAYAKAVKEYVAKQMFRQPRERGLTLP